MTNDELVDEILQWGGMDLDAAVKIAPALLPFFNHPLGLHHALTHFAPELAEQAGIRIRQ